MEIPVMAHNQNDNSGSSLTDLPNVGEHGCFVSRQIVRFMQYSWNGAFLGLKEWFSKGLLLYNFSALRQALSLLSWFDFVILLFASEHLLL